ncbi:tyrosinase [Microdochium nivale]|nr:tyrosinase [Microdochium nivale]
MRFSSLVPILLSLTVVTSAAPATTTIHGTACTTPATRQEWRTFTPELQAGYMAAIKCLTTKPSRLGLSTSLYDDFPYVHAKLNLDIHFAAQFLPWHRLFVHLYETALRADCGYKGRMPYWDWTRDSGTLLSSTVVRDFGGNGLGGGWSSPARPNPLVSCVTGGPLANVTLPYYEGGERPHCLNRQINNGTGSAAEALWLASFYTPAAVANITNTSRDFATFWTRLERDPHGAIHNALGGDMGPSTSPNDPLFMMHHAQVDRLWWLWQRAKSPAREADFGGKRVDGTNATLQDVMTYLGIGANVTVQGVMSTETKLLCYKYV